MSATVRNAVGLTVASALSLLAVACDEPAPKCNIARGPFSAKYTLVPGSATGTPDCAGLVGEMVRVDVYYQPISKKDPQPNLDHASAAFQPQTLSDALYRASIATPTAVSDLDPTDAPYAYGAFTDTYPKDGFCTIPTLSVARAKLPDVPDMTDDMCMYTPAQAAIDVSYTWSNVRVYVKPEANGTQFVADMVYATPTCSAQYQVVGLYPYVTCGVDTTAAPPAPATGDSPDGGIADASAQGLDGAVDIDGSSNEDPGDVLADGGEADDDGACPPPVDTGDPAAAQVPDDTLCSAVADLAQARQASGINPEFATQCDPVLLTCVLKADPPSLLP
ncbi:MAG: MlpA protein [Myxococcaceae bacterium]|nr:MlpA protein [Myxococcaceae bacterium]